MKEIVSTTVVTAGTSQSLVDIGCVPHHPQLYQSDLIWPDGVVIDNSDDDHDVIKHTTMSHSNDHDDDGDNDRIIERWVQQFHRDGFVVIPDAVSMILSNANNYDTTTDYQS